jgi:GDP/UDP-N,N'-diacetylbacillosamine 2-epimerase (hydrolysing)
MGMLPYLSALQFVDGVAGNSSSGIIEAPSFKIGTINIGDRQRGRVRAESVTDCECRKKDILEAVKKMYSPEFQEMLKNVVNVYGQNNTSDRIINVLKTIDAKNLLKKKFYDLEIR